MLYINLAIAGCGKSTPPTSSNRPGGNGPGRQGGQQAISVAVAPVVQRDLPVFLTGLGTVTAYNTVVVKSRVDGQLVQVAVREGQEVQKGQLLAEIDPRPFEVQLKQAEATLYRDQAALKDAQVNAERFQGLFKEGVISRQQLDTQVAQSGQLEGAVRADQAQISNAKLNLVYSKITAPISGRVGLRLVDVGNMVHASDQNGMFVITQLHPIAVIFTLPETQLPEVASQMKKGTLEVDAYSQDNQTKLSSGKLESIDNQIDPTTGTGRLKAVFPNGDNQLWPNQFVNVKLLLQVRKNNIVLPAAAVQRGPQGTYVYVVKPDSTVELTPVTVAFQQGDSAAVSSGVTPGAVVVTDGVDKLQSGSKVVARNTAPGKGGNGSTAGNKVAQTQEAPAQ